MSKILIDAFGESKARAAINDSFGHLRAKPGSHCGYMIFACGEYGDLVSIVSDFENVTGSPWFFQAHQDFICDHAKERGSLYLFEGEYRMPKGKDKVGNFVGKVTTIDPAKLLNTK